MHKYNKKFGDIWLRARHNALANLEAAEEASKRVVRYEIIISFLIILPIASTILAKSCPFFSRWDVLLSLIGGLGALYFSLVGFVQNARKKDEYHRRAHSVFNNIAQKTRRADNPTLDEQESQYLMRFLEEMFETAKSNSFEPSDINYNSGWKRLQNMPKLPFGLDIGTPTSKGKILTEKSDIEQNFQLYESLNTGSVHASWVSSFNFEDKRVLDIGSGSGRDAAYFASRGAQFVVAVDSSYEMLRLAKQKHGENKILWLLDSLPDLKSLSTAQLGSFDFILCSAVLMLLSEEEQSASIRTIIKLLNEGGTAIITIKTDDSNNAMCSLTPEFSRVLSEFGAKYEKLNGNTDLLKREGVNWKVYKIAK